jgi:hypothetical protein
MTRRAPLRNEQVENAIAFKAFFRFIGLADFGTDGLMVARKLYCVIY